MMLNYLEKYNKLPLEIKQKFSSPAMLATIKDLEKKYQVVLSSFIIKLIVGEFPRQSLVSIINQELALFSEQAEALARDLKQNIFSIPSNAEVADYLPPEVINESINQVKDTDKKTSQIIAEAKINFASLELEERFKKIISTYLRGIRDKINTKEALMKEVDSGGLGFDINSAESILKLAKDEPAVAPIKQPSSWLPAETVKPSIARDVEYDLAASIKARQAQEKPTQAILEPPVPIRQQADVATTVTTANQAPKMVLEPPVPTVTEKSVEETPVAKDNRPRTESGKIKMEDIQISPKIYTPVDELKYMTVKNFRILSHDPVRAMEIIKKKIEVLGEEDYGKKVEGIQGWKISPVNRMYIEAYQEAINAGKSVENILAKKQKENPDYITGEEFEAILAFNQEINKLIH